MSHSISSLSRLVVLLTLLCGSPAAAQQPADASENAATVDRTAASLLPESTVLYAEIPNPKKLVGTILDHPLRSQVERIDAYKSAFETPEYAKFRLVLSLVEAQLGMNWRTAIETIGEGGVYFGLDLERKGGALLIKASDSKTAKRAHGVLLRMAGGEAKKKDGELKEHTYRGLTGYKVGEAIVFTQGRWIIAVNSDKLARAIVDNLLDADSEHKNLSTVKTYQNARRTIIGQPTAWAFLRVERLREAGFGKDLYAEKSNNAGLEMLAGGILGTLIKTPYATASLVVENQGLRLALSVPYQSDWIAEARQHYFGPQGRGQAPEPLKPADALLSIETHRDLGHMWQSAADLFDQKANADLVQADSNLSTLFAGRQFSEDVLGALRPEIQLVAARQTFVQSKTPVPQIKLPAAAVIFRLKNPEKTARSFKVSFQSLVGFLNITGAQNGLPPLDLSTRKTDDGLLITTEYLVEEEDKNDGKLHHNFSPSVAFCGDRLIIASTHNLGAELLGLCAKQQSADTSPAKESDPIVNTNASIDLAVVKKVLDDNRDQLVAHNMLSDGHTKEEAEGEIGMLLQLLSYFRDGSIRLSSETRSQKTQQLRLELSVGVNVPQSK